MFQFTHPVWGATQETIRHIIVPLVSIHAPRVGCDVRFHCLSLRASAFQFTHPVWGATTTVRSSQTEILQFQFTHPVWGATSKSYIRLDVKDVSIHAPRVGCDFIAWNYFLTEKRFQFTHPVWGATGYGGGQADCLRVSIHAPRVGCDTGAL